MSEEIKPMHTWARMVGHEIQKVVDFCWEQYQKTGSASVDLISPQELSRLRQIEEWAKSVRLSIWNIRAEGYASDLAKSYDAITAPVEGEK